MHPGESSDSHSSMSDSKGHGRLTGAHGLVLRDLKIVGAPVHNANRGQKDTGRL